MGRDRVQSSGESLALPPLGLKLDQCFQHCLCRPVQAPASWEEQSRRRCGMPLTWDSDVGRPLRGTRTWDATSVPACRSGGWRVSVGLRQELPGGTSRGRGTEQAAARAQGRRGSALGCPGGHGTPNTNPARTAAGKDLGRLALLRGCGQVSRPDTGAAPPACTPEPAGHLGRPGRAVRAGTTRARTQLVALCPTVPPGLVLDPPESATGSGGTSCRQARLWEGSRSPPSACWGPRSKTGASAN